MRPEIALSILGPALTTAGAGLLAYDVLRGPARTLRDVRLTMRVGAADDDRAATALLLAAARAEQSTDEHSTDLARIDADHADAVNGAESWHAAADARDRARAYRLAIWGLCLVGAGGAAETIAAIFAAMGAGR